VKKSGIAVLTVIATLLIFGVQTADCERTGNLGYNSYEGYLSGGAGLNHYFGSGPGYPMPDNKYGLYSNAGGDYFRRYIPPEQWGRFGYGTGHLGTGYGPYIFSPQEGGPPPGMFDPLPGSYMAAPPPSIKVKRGCINVSLPGDIPGIKCVTVTVLAFNNAELATQTISCPPYKFTFPVMDGCKNVRVKIDYVNAGLSATAYPL